MAEAPGYVSRSDIHGKGPDQVGGRKRLDQTRERRPTALSAARVEFIDENGGGPGVRLRKSAKQKR